MKLTLFQFLKEQLSSVPPVVRADLAGKTVLVVGANNGIGFEASKHFASMNPGKLILACRNQAKADAALASIQEATGCTTAEVWIIDVSNFASVKAFGDRYEKEGGRLDIVVLNAAILPSPTPAMTDDGWEISFQTNDLSLSLLSILLLPRMLETAEKFNTLPRLVVVSSEVHHWATLKQEVLKAPNPLRVFGGKDSYTDTEARYCESKLLNVLFVRALASRLQAKPLIVNTVNPGFCLSNLRSNFSGIDVVKNYLMELFLARTSEAGARQLVWAALGDEGKEDALRGAYISCTQVSEVSDWVLSEEGKTFQDKLWSNLIDELGKVDPKVGTTVGHYLDAPQ